MFSGREFVAAVLTGFVLSRLAIAQLPQYGNEVYRPSVGQAGKDVVWVRTPDAMVTRMLQAVTTADQDHVIDLGAGDGRFATAAAKQFGARSMGIEYKPDMAALAKRSAERAGVADKVTIIQGDVFKEDFSRGAVLTLCLLPDLNLELRPTILGMNG
jgi:SAM-dependent methyltransferase